jgi:hypothetical protein
MHPAADFSFFKISIIFSLCSREDAWPILESSDAPALVAGRAFNCSLRGVLHLRTLYVCDAVIVPVLHGLDGNGH